ncbi:macro domain-containing protein [Acetobacterium wieringae]|uniref:Macro domain-containing protein n=1 Tax=Acetobacterium wieringae TaxID=52694 RepID=A0ABY6H9K7_9FIRM|nr:macro domain-containing protein [Acetobacterium wieringae]UYO61167.1 macro domain-containing protein [Acetobacterium wieringae]VUZ24431.1 O-acetyl-ADP-ribose deacetylase [Acetobacterium wieringae]
MQFELIRNDITKMAVDAIVLPANTKLREGSGTSKAIFEKAGRKELEKACNVALKKDDQIYMGGAIPTLAFKLDAKFIIHAIVPKWIDGEHQEYDKLSSAYLSALGLADVMSCESIAFPLLASGHNRFDQNIAFEIAKESIEAYQPTNKLKRVLLVLYSPKAMQIARTQGFLIEEAIDDVYILGIDENYVSPGQRALNDGMELAGKFLDDGINMAMAFLDDQENRKKILEGGIMIAQIAISVVLKK